MKLPRDKPRKPWLAVLLSLAVTGLGHVYAGRAKKGLVFYLLQAVVSAIVLAIIIFYVHINSYVFALACWVIFVIYCAVDALKTARMSNEPYMLKKYNRWYVYLLLYILSYGVVHLFTGSLVKENIIRAYKIPSGAMLPTVIVGDHVLVNRFIYTSNVPKVSDIIVFESPKNPEVDYLKRIVAAAGDTVEIKNKKLWVNGIQVKEEYIRHTDLKLLDKESSPRDNFGPITVPEDAVFVLGDNRDNSFDSRFWGFVRRDQIRGKVISIYWSWDRDDMKVRWGRIGEQVE